MCRARGPIATGLGLRLELVRWIVVPSGRVQKREISMLFRNRFRTALEMCAFATASLIAAPSSADLQSFVNKPETAFEWQLKNRSEHSIFFFIIRRSPRSTLFPTRRSSDRVGHLHRTA